MIRKKTTLIQKLTLGILSIVLAFGTYSCSEENEPEVTSGQTATVKFVISGYEGGQSSTLKSAKQGRSVVLDAYMKPLNDEVALVATLEQDASSLKRTTSAFSTGTMIRVIAVKTGTLEYVSRGDFVVDGNVDSVATFHVPLNATYDFYFVSYNRTDSVPSDTIPPFENQKLGENDFLLTKVTKTITAADQTLTNVTLEQCFPRVAIQFDASADAMQISSMSAYFSDSYQTASIAADGTLSNGAGSYDATYGFDYTTTIGMAIPDTSRTVYVPDSITSISGSEADATTHNFSVHINTITFADTTWNGLTAYFNRNLLPGVKYTINVTLARTAFAGSNIYWDSSAGYPTFDNVKVTTNEQHQGLLFKWGSLWGISPKGSVDDEYTTSTVVYKPTSSGWGDATGTAWGSIPYVSTIVNANDNASMQINYLYNNVTASYSTGTGDICKYLADNGYAPTVDAIYTWRMPTASEIMYDSYGSGQTWGSNNSYGWSKVGSWGTALTSTSDLGIYDIAIGATKLGAFFPVSGMREGDAGSIYYAAGEGLWYWTGSSSYDDTDPTLEIAFALYMTNTTFGKLNTYRTNAMPIRCVRVKL